MSFSIWQVSVAIFVNGYCLRYDKLTEMFFSCRIGTALDKSVIAVGFESDRWDWIKSQP